MWVIVGSTRVSSTPRRSVRRSSISMYMRGVPSSRDQLGCVPHVLILASIESMISGSRSKPRQLHEAKSASQWSPILIRLPLTSSITASYIGDEVRSRWRSAHRASWIGQNAGLENDIPVTCSYLGFECAARGGVADLGSLVASTDA